jgi:hypothetical protein
MKKTFMIKPHAAESDNMLPEYKFDYRKAHPNRFAERIYKDRRVVILDRDIAKVFTTAESVNAILRALITTMPKPAKVKTSRKALQR